jgi:hypothetical protein
MEKSKAVEISLTALEKSESGPKHNNLTIITIDLKSMVTLPKPKQK